jgi:branched-chain amino acid transport system permease protein
VEKMAFDALLLQTIINGLLIGAMYALIALGLNVIYGVMDFINFAHGEFIMLSMYATYFVFVLLGWDPFLSLPISMLLLFATGAISEVLLVKPILGQRMVIQVFTTYGLLLFLRNMATFLWTSTWRTLSTPYSDATIPIGEIRISVAYLLASIVSLLFAFGLYMFFRKTDVGIAIRATMQSKEAARLMGINVDKVYMLTFGLGGMCAGVAGGLLTLVYPIQPEVGELFCLLAFVICVIGGMGDFLGAVVGGFTIGLTESLAGFFVAPAYKHIIAFIVFIIVLIIRPKGLRGK